MDWGVSVLSATLKNTKIHVPCEKYWNVTVLQTVKPLSPNCLVRCIYPHFFKTAEDSRNTKIAAGIQVW